jgi:hypothetical protein
MKHFRNTFLALTAIALTIGLMSACKKDNPAPTESCNCYTQVETLEQVLVNGQIVNQWVIDYTTDSEAAPCSNATDYTYQGQANRSKVICQ